MNADSIVELGRQAIIISVQLTGPILLATLAVGLLIAMFQAATQINEMTLTFVPKLIIMAVIMLLAGPWMLEVLVDYTRELIRNIPNLIG
ncbi:flagellar biosynthesis protein FliQ [Methylococcus sp. EFPC2]|uniref:flagellar biosynthesis protein FliQ n=1 Tax=Methylococcus sp. EFPC2 TaxID=2812648 RepID=UPI001966FF56|nr:flagellar biosynthesis protein FliQ [Methylococcus sp. EFPC2]QSA97639.1 flagellar biosynthesis protein FliQ [Methylococcus sp. EFPC2]